MGWLQDDTHVDVGQPFAPKPNTSVPATLIGAEEEQRLVILFRGGGDRLRRHAGTLLRRGSVPKAGLTGKAEPAPMRNCPQGTPALLSGPELCCVPQELETNMTIPGFRPVIFNKGAVGRCQPLKAMGEMLVEPAFWYESFPNWRSEFLSIAVLLVLGIDPRERGSPESKPVGAPHAMTGH